MVFMIFLGADMMNATLALTAMPAALAGWVSHLRGPFDKRRVGFDKLSPNGFVGHMPRFVANQEPHEIARAHG
jgi:hypothetical protein